MGEGCFWGGRGVRDDLRWGRGAFEGALCGGEGVLFEMGEGFLLGWAKCF